MARSESTWYTTFNFLVAVDIGSPVSAIHLPQEHPAGGLEKHFFVGDINGKLHIFSMAGRILHEHQTDGASPITAISEGKFRCDGRLRWMNIGSGNYSIMGTKFESLELENVLHWDRVTSF